MNSRRHTDNFIPSQKSPIALNRYDDFDEVAPGGGVKPRPRSPEPRLYARALYNFVGQTARELTFRKGEIIHVRRQVDKNWYEGELNAMVGLFPVNHVEVGKNNLTCDDLPDDFFFRGTQKSRATCRFCSAAIFTPQVESGLH